MFKVNINTCAYQNLRALPGIGQVIADRIWELRKEGHIDENILPLFPD
jgi:DNA uptake protein ComE-like DNA-binding protein